MGPTCAVPHFHRRNRLLPREIGLLRNFQCRKIMPWIFVRNLVRESASGTILTFTWARPLVTPHSAKQSDPPASGRPIILKRKKGRLQNFPRSSARTHVSAGRPALSHEPPYICRGHIRPAAKRDLHQIKTKEARGAAARKKTFNFFFASRLRLRSHFPLRFRPRLASTPRLAALSLLPSLS